MSKKKPPRSLTTYAGIGLLLAGLVGWDLHVHQICTLFVGSAESLQDSKEPLQVEGLPILRPGTLTLGEGHPAVALAASTDGELPQPAPLDAVLSYEQVDALVRRALDLDQLGKSIRQVIAGDDWVLLKVNIVTNRGNPNSAYYTDGFEHPGQLTDQRVVKSVINYLIEKVGPRRITIAEGGAESPRRGELGFPTNAKEDGWSATYPEFDNLSYIKILEEFKGRATLVDTVDLNYAPYRSEPVPGGAIQRLGVRVLDYAGAQFGFHIEGTGTFRKDFIMPEPILDADKIISMPAMKTTIYGTTLGLKNYVGTLASRAYGDNTSKSQHYQNNPEHGYIDLFSYNPAAYTIIEGLWGTEGDGPQWGQNVQHNVIVAGSDPVATESVADVVMGFNPLDLEALYLAAAKGFGTLNLNNIQVVGRPPQSVQRNFTKSRGGSEKGFFYGRGIRRWLVAGPYAGGDIAMEYLADEASLEPVEGQSAGDRVWEKVEHLGYSAELLELGELYGKGSEVTNYAFTLIQSPQTQDGFLWMGYDERAKGWLNGEVIFENPARRTFTLAGNRIPIHLAEGENRLLLKISNFTGDTVLSAHIVDEDGDRLPGIEFLLPGEGVTAVEEENAALPVASSLLGNYPNPFNPATHIRFALSEAGPMRLEVFSAAGQRVRTLVEGDLAAGTYEQAWDGRDAAGYNAASGVYFARLQAGTLSQAKAMALVR
ncbi:MAG: DUF362 domain-containing protein [Candidatus Latescibacteria bacterium]|nr:DUF362 domain-containing protein [Candidatus Latescibacterota bacterium]